MSGIAVRVRGTLRLCNARVGCSIAHCCNVCWPDTADLAQLQLTQEQQQQKLACHASLYCSAHLTDTEHLHWLECIVMGHLIAGV